MTIKWGIIGAGLISERNMIPAMLKADNAQIVAVMDIDENRVQQMADKFSIPRFYSSEKALLEDKDVDAVYVATPAYLHAKEVIEAAEHGKHILCEKPMAMTVKECEEMITACQRNNVNLGMGFMLRYHPHHLKAKELIETKTIGDIVKVRAQWNVWYPPPANGPWRHDRKLGGGGCSMDVGIHCADLLRFIVGEEVEQVLALADNVIFEYPVEDSSTLLLRFKTSVHGIIENSFAIDTKNSPNGLEIYGTKGVITTNKTISCFIGGTMTTFIDGKEKTYPASDVDTYQKEVESFGRKIESGESSIDENGLEALKVILAGYESAKAKKAIVI